MLNFSICGDIALFLIGFHLRYDHRNLFAHRLVPVPFVVWYHFDWICLLPSLHERLLVFVQRLQDFANWPPRSLTSAELQLYFDIRPFLEQFLTCFNIIS